jgi:intracellular sulfur oxidation DsrE/DsrF family protein
MVTISRSIFILIGLFFTTTLWADRAEKQVNQILASKKPPTGVVFEIVMSKEGLRKAIPRIKGYMTKLKARHPEIKIAVVSHGSEQFALTKKNQKKYKAVHKEVKSLVKLDVPVHICETHAGWRGVQAEDFPKYVTVSTTGPGEVRNYVEFGYTKIILD